MLPVGGSNWWLPNELRSRGLLRPDAELSRDDAGSFALVLLFSGAVGLLFGVGEMSPLGMPLTPTEAVRARTVTVQLNRAMTAAEEAIGARQPTDWTGLWQLQRDGTYSMDQNDYNCPTPSCSDGVSTLGEQRAKHESRTERIRKRLAQIEARDEATRQKYAQEETMSRGRRQLLWAEGLLGEIRLAERVLGGAGPPVELSIVGPPVGLSSVEVFPR